MSEIPRPVITRISTNPVKGMRTAYQSKTTTWLTGLAHDRQYVPAVESADGLFTPLTRRDASGLALFDVELSATAVTMTYQGESFPLLHGVEPEGERRPLTLFETAGIVAEVSPEASDFVTDYLDIGRKVFLVKTVGRRAVDESVRIRELGAAMVMNFQNAYPITIASELSLTALNACTQELGGLPATMDHFKPTIVVDAFYGTDGRPKPFAEDYLLRAQLQSGLSMIAVRALTRGARITQDPKTGKNTHNELLKVLAQLRGGSDMTNGERGSFFGVGLVHDKACQWIGVGDELAVEMSTEPWITQ